MALANARGSVDKLDPEPGLVIEYDFLWSSDKRRGREHGAKLRPCAVLAVDEDGVVSVCGITHTDPGSDDLRVAIDDEHMQALGLDGEPQWIDCSEVNELIWSDPGIQKTAWGDWEYGFLGDDALQEMADKVKAQMSAKQLKEIDRIAAEKKRLEAESAK